VQHPIAFFGLVTDIGLSKIVQFFMLSSKRFIVRPTVDFEI